MKNELAKAIEEVKANENLLFFDEAAVKIAVILRLLSILGWNPFNIDKVTPEYTVANKRVNYSFMLLTQPHTQNLAALIA